MQSVILICSHLQLIIDGPVVELLDSDSENRPYCSLETSTHRCLHLTSALNDFSAIQQFSQSLTFNFPLVIGLYSKTSVRASMGKLFYSRSCVQPTYDAQEYQTCADTAFPGYQLTPQIYISCALRNSRQTNVGLEPRASRSAVGRVITRPTHLKISLPSLFLRYLLKLFILYHRPLAV